jgi:hypothetical protein
MESPSGNIRVEATVVDAIMWLIIGLVSAWLAYSVTASERRGRSWGPVTAVGVYLALFGAAASGLNWVYGLMRPKLVDSFPSENSLLFIGLVVLVGLVVLALDLLGTIDIMGQIQKSINSGRPNPGGPSGDD